MGLPFEKIFDAIHIANMGKEPANENIRSTRGNQYDVIKPNGWMPPEPEIANAIYKAKDMYENQ
jgi:predicted HAD superfamily Cof-like phosphohydrolase